MTLTQLIYAVKIADLRSMNKAAAELFVSQPALSGAIKELEEEIHTKIFIRNNRGVVTTIEGEEFLRYARQMVELHTLIDERYIEEKQYRKKFSVSMQHYSFAVEAFIELANQYSMDEFEFAVHETKTHEVIDNVKNFRSELGVLYLNEFNQNVMRKIFAENDLEFISLFTCGISVYLSKNHPLAEHEIIKFEELNQYPCLSFEQGEKNSFYFAEEVLSTLDYRQIIKANDRATMLNLMVGMKGYTLCSGIICEELNGGDYLSIPLDTEDTMTIGYIKRNKIPLSVLGEQYVDILKKYGKGNMCSRF
ncbi:MAG TPA: LysR family transcriptional regulator [Bacillota bacterium]|nr:LysR family transcriptional regulator [Bacillota bacterium]